MLKNGFTLLGLCLLCVLLFVMVFVCLLGRYTVLFRDMCDHNGNTRRNLEMRDNVLKLNKVRHFESGAAVKQPFVCRAAAGLP